MSINTDSLTDRCQNFDTKPHNIKHLTFNGLITSTSMSINKRTADKV